MVLVTLSVVVTVITLVSKASKYFLTTLGATTGTDKLRPIVKIPY